MRLLFVHAHPDDETLATGIAIAAYAAAGHDVHVLTCTLGEEGEVIPPELAHLDAAHDDTLAQWRRGELAAALTALGAHGQLLGADASGEPAYRDSGMAGTSSAARPDAFVNADPSTAISLVRNVIQHVAPEVVVTYDNQGGYGHPDHIQAHRLTCAAVALMPEPPRLYATVTPLSWALADRAWVRAHVDAPGITLPDDGEPFPSAVRPDADVARTVVAPEAVGAYLEALRAHRTQVTVFDGWYALSNNIAARLRDREAFARLDARTGLIVAEGAQ